MHRRLIGTFLAASAMVAAEFRPVLGFGIALLLVVCLTEWVVEAINQKGS
jgi:hypothetical protein